MIEVLVAAQTGVALFSLSVLFYIATKMSIVNDVSHNIRDILLHLDNKLK